MVPLLVLGLLAVLSTTVLGTAIPYKEHPSRQLGSGLAYSSQSQSLYALNSNLTVEIQDHELSLRPPDDALLALEYHQGNRQKWDLNPNWLGVVRAAGTTKCLDATHNPRAGLRLKVYECHGADWQLFYYHQGYLELVYWGLCLTTNSMTLQNCHTDKQLFYTDAFSKKT